MHERHTRLKAYFTDCRNIFRDRWNQFRTPEEIRRFRIVCLATVICSMTAHGFLFSNEFFSHDSMDFSTLGIHFYASVGRFLIRLYEFFRGELTIPWLIGLLFMFWMSLASYVTVHLLGIRSTWGVILTCGLLCTNVSLTLTGATYIYCMDVYALAFLCAAAGAYLFCRGGWYAPAGLIPLVCSLGLYQPYFTAAASLCLIALLRRTALGENFIRVMLTGIRCLVLLAAGFALYYLLWQKVCAVFGMTPQRMDESLLGSGLAALPKLIAGANLEYFKFLLHRTTSQRHLLSAVHIILFVLLGIRLVRLMCCKNLPAVNRIVIPLLSLLLPTAFYSARILFAGGFNDLTAFAGELLYLLALPGMESDSKSRYTLLGRAAVIILLGLVLWQHVIFANQVYLKKDLEKNATLVLAGRILDQIESVEGYDPGVTPIAFAGMLSYNWKVNIVEWQFLEIQNWTGLYNSYAATYNMGSYITQYLHYPVPLDRDRDYSQLPEVKAMPMYPAPGSVKMVDGTVVVKLSE